MKIFTFWENANGKSTPAYIELCRDTWDKNILGAEVICINYDNLNEYIGGTYNVEKLKKLTLQCQSDLISFALLEKYGGLWLDADTIITRDIVDTIKNIDSANDKIIMFGEHLAFIYASSSSNPALKSIVKISQERLNVIKDADLENKKYPWNYFGNQILTIVKEDHHNLFHSINPSSSGYIPENNLFSNIPCGPERYRALYFNENNIPVDMVLSNANFGIIGLHNSWTPEKYKYLNEKKLVLNGSEMMSKLLSEVLNVDVD